MARATKAETAELEALLERYGSVDALMIGRAAHIAAEKHKADGCDECRTDGVRILTAALGEGTVKATDMTVAAK